MPFFIVIERQDLPPADGSQLSYQFVLPPSYMDAKVDQLYLDDLWIALLDKSARYLWCRLSVCSIEELLEQDVLEGYLLTGDVERSEYLLRPGEQSKELQIDKIAWVKSVPLNRVSVINEKEAESLVQAVEGCCPIRVIPPDPGLLRDISLGSMDLPPYLQLRYLVRQLKTKFTRSELYRYMKYPTGWSPFEGLAYSHFEIKRPDLAGTLYNVLCLGHTVSETGWSTSSARLVDTGLREIHPDRVRVRRFVNPPTKDIDDFGLDTLFKIDRAEAMHQRIVADLASRVHHLGRIPYETNSIDLYVQGDRACTVFEIKSSTPHNFYRQCIRGAIQVKEYCYALGFSRDLPFRSAVIIEHRADSGLQDYCRGFLQYMGVSMLYYHEAVSWPDRVPGFDETVASIE